MITKVKSNEDAKAIMTSHLQKKAKETTKVLEKEAFFLVL